MFSRQNENKWCSLENSREIKMFKNRYFFSSKHAFGFTAIFHGNCGSGNSDIGFRFHIFNEPHSGQKSREKVQKSIFKKAPKLYNVNCTCLSSIHPSNL